MKDFFIQSVGGSVHTYVQLTQMDVEAACSELSTSSAACAEGAPVSLLKTCRKEFSMSKPLLLLCRATLDHGLIPQDLLLVLVSSVQKGGSIGTAKNYRQLALTSHLITILEGVVLEGPGQSS